MVIAGTGHRRWDSETATVVQHWLYTRLSILKPERVISGMALGFDTWLAADALALGIPFVAAVPFEGQEWRWPKRDQERYQNLLREAVEVYVVCHGPYGPWMYQTRNEWMVDHSDLVLAGWLGTKGGTANCVAYARKVGRALEVWRA